MRSYFIRPSSNITDVLIGRQETETHDERGGNWHDAAKSQGTPKIDSHDWKLGKGKEGSYPESQRKPGTGGKLLASRIVSQRISFIISHSVCRICYISPRKLILSS